MKIALIEIHITTKIKLNEDIGRYEIKKLEYDLSRFSTRLSFKSDFEGQTFEEPFRLIIKRVLNKKIIRER